MRTILNIPPDALQPGYRFGFTGSRSTAGTTIDFWSIMPGAKHPFPHRMMQITLDRDGLLNLIDELIEEATP